MFRARKTPGSFVSPSGPFRKSFHDGYRPLPRVRLLGPAAWSIAACSTIYLGCAAYEVYQDVQRVRAKETRWSPKTGVKTFEELERFKDRESTNTIIHRHSRSSTRGQSERPEFSDPQTLTMGIMGLTAGLHLASNVAPSMMRHFVHVPSMSRNYTLLTSTFGHAGLMHLGLNLYGMWWLMPSAARSPTFKESSAHLTAFYLSAGILSSLAQHATAVWPRPSYMSSLGASGALFAMLGIVGISFPNTQLGIILIPGSLPITQALACIALFDAIGIFVRYPYLRLGHASHLSGLAVGVAYAKYGGDKKIWRPGRKLVFSAMRSLGVL